ncbi:NPCBM/NEW2 domain-containing protein [Humisphaera borealis]|uniref:NPCBM/NEW2 domain-containing protein n=1 Tax=Humisphaera borealis TaxID=2807512 RepID=A0A7M2WYG2_9BACT|nr:NPCBM/NEW2 domain-containing protein [Humisphaera borealis]QOV90459.1 NPCBM/NEW2 domain-containing protein [Humisphaera borealis]
MIRFNLLRLLFLAAIALPAGSAFAWGEPHLAITKAALEVLPPWQQQLLGDELAPLAGKYCMIPDNVFTDRPNARFAMIEGRAEVYLLNLHLPAQQPENLQTLRYFMGKAVDALRAKNVKDAARYMGTICHQIEDYGSPSHTMPGDNMFTLLQQFMPPPDAMKDQLLHGPVENGTFAVTLADYKPALLGTTVDEASWRLLHRIHDGILNARSTTLPIIQALYADDAKRVESWQIKAAKVDAQVVADAMYTILCLGAERFDEAEQKSLRRVAIGGFFPLEAASLYYPQSQFYSSPHWGHARSGVILAEGKKAMPLRLRVSDGDGTAEREFTNGVSAGMGKSLMFHLPRGTYARFSVLGGLHPQLGEKGKVEFAVIGDGKTLASAIVAGTEPAHAFDCDISGVAELKLSLTSRGSEPKSNYAIWAEPLLIKP